MSDGEQPGLTTPVVHYHHPEDVISRFSSGDGVTQFVSRSYKECLGDGH